MENEKLYSYEGVLTFEALAAERLTQVNKLLTEIGVRCLSHPTWLDFKYSGKDHERTTVGFLCQLATVIQNADGEIVCEIEEDDKDVAFEFFTIADGLLFKQSGHIVRRQKEKVMKS